MKDLRINIIFLIFIFGFLIIFTRLFFLQIKNSDYWKALAKGQQTIFKSEIPERGAIFFQDKEGNLYLGAANKKEKFCYLLLNEIPQEKRKELFEEISQILNLKKELFQKIQENKSSFLILKKNITPKEEKKIKQLKKKGIYIGERLKRFYPQESFASHVLGFVGGEGKGQYGIEGFYEEILKGKDGKIKGERDVHGFLTFLNLKESILPQKGKNLILTIDFFIQSFAEKLLERAKEDFKAQGGEIIVVNPKSGEIKALATFPNFNLNRYFEYELKFYKNPAIQSLFEPGSVVKPVTMAGALELGKITPDTKYTDEGFVKIGGYKILNYGGRVWGQRTMAEVLQYSINTGAVFVEKKLGHKNFLDFLEKFGFFEKTGIDLQGEIFSENLEFKKGYEINFATASFGQGIQITPIQLARAFCAIANGGKLIKPYILEKFVDEDNKIKENRVEIQREVMSSETSKKLTEMLVNVVEKGYGKRAKIPGYFIAGKTGTSQIPFSSLGIEKKGYSDKTWQSFVGYFPAFNPQFLILVKLDNPNTKSAEYSSAVIFKELAKYIIDYWQIPPDYLVEKIEKK